VFSHLAELITVASQRRVVKPFTFSNGVTVPSGARIGAPTVPLQFDETVYENPNQFDGFRFHKLREQEGDAEKHQASTASINYLHFGLGHHVWYPHESPKSPPNKCFNGMLIVVLVDSLLYMRSRRSSQC